MVLVVGDPLGLCHNRASPTLPMDGQSTIILDRPLSCWRESHEDYAAGREYAVHTERRTRTAQRCQSSSQNRQDVWDTDLRVGKRQGGGEETVNRVTTVHGKVNYFKLNKSTSELIGT